MKVNVLINAKWIYVLMVENGHNNVSAVDIPVLQAGVKVPLRCY